MNLTLRQLGYFIAAGETGSVTLAARRQNISQPAISTAIAHIERELGVQLFLRRHAQGLSLTPAGRTLLREARRLLKQADGLYSVVGEAGQQLRGELAVGWFTTLAPVLMPELLQSFVADHPGVRLATREGHQEELVTALRRGEIDLAVTYDLEIEADIAFRSLATLPPYVLLAATHPLAQRRQISLAELAPLPMVLLDLPQSRDYFLGLFRHERLEPSIAWTSRQSDVVRTLVANGLGYSLANVRPRAELALDGRALTRVALAGDPPPMRIGLATLRELAPTRPGLAFAAHLAARIGDGRVPGMAAQAKPPQRRRGAGARPAPAVR